MMKKYYIETYGCQMNKYDSELVTTILAENGYIKTENVSETDIILINTCSVRQHAEDRVKNKLDNFQSIKKANRNLIIGVLGCMAQRLGDDLIKEKSIVDFAVGPDEYRNLSQIIADINSNNREIKQKSYQTLDINETYANIFPTRSKNINAWIAIMRGCNNYCSYCIVPHVRGRERSRKVQSIIAETENIVKQGFPEVTLLGQNVNSYKDGDTDFSVLIEAVSQIAGIKRVRFATSHPKDLSVKLIKTIAENPKICNHIHLPVQSGSSKILQKMNRNYTREHYLNLIHNIRKYIKEPGIYTDIIVGFPGETNNDFNETYNLVEQAEFDSIFIFKYSPRVGTAAYNLKETVSEKEKVERLQIINELQKKITVKRNRNLINSIQKVLVEGPSRKNIENQLMGRTDTNKIVVFQSDRSIPAGSLIDLTIIAAEGQTLFGEILHVN